MRNALKKNKQLQLKLWWLMKPCERLYHALVHYRNMKGFWRSDKAKELMKTFIELNQKPV